MTIDPACVECIINQSRRVADAIHADEALKEEIISTAVAMSKDFSFQHSPPEVATPLYEKMALLAKKYDLYDEVKAHSTEKARSFIPHLTEAIAASPTPLLTATKIAVAGNVIDLAAEVEFDLHEEIATIFETAFALNDFDRLAQKLSQSQSLLYIGDNVGEHIFDYLYIKTIGQLYPELKIYYMVRGNPIINDVTLKEAEEAEFGELCEIVDSGVPTPGFVYTLANERSRELFDTSDMVITKGMGNYECLSPSPRGDLLYLLKIKCNVVARSLGQEIGSLICKMV